MGEILKDSGYPPLCEKFSDSAMQGSYRLGREKFKDFSRTFKAMYQKIQRPNG